VELRPIGQRWTIDIAVARLPPENERADALAREAIANVLMLR
jgi:hypothetical protein